MGIVESRDRHGRIRQPISDRVYLVLEGEGEFFFGDKKGRTRSYRLPRKIWYSYKYTAYAPWGRTCLSLVRASAYTREFNVHLDDHWD